MKKYAFILTVFVAVILMWEVTDLPRWGDPGAPAHTAKTGTHFIEKTFEETSVPNLVTAVLADYRGYDTMFETVVVFIAGLGIMSIIGFGNGWNQKPTSSTPVEDTDLIINMTMRFLVPAIQLFAFYVIAHGHYSPGGGFQGGALLAASFVLIALSRELDDALKLIPPPRMVLLGALGVLIYSGWGLLCLLLGQNFLDYAVLEKILPMDAIAARSFSMLIVEIGVAFTVASILFAIFAHLSTRGKLKEGL